MTNDIHGLFDLSSKGPKKKPQKTTAAPIIPSSLNKTEVLPNEDVQSQLNKMKEIQTNFTLQIEELFKKSGQDRQTLAKFCQNPSNFSKEQWESLQQQKEELELLLSGHSKETL